MLRRKRAPVAPNRGPTALEPRAKNEIHHLAIAPDPFVHSIRAEIVVVHRPARAPQERKLTALQPRDDGLDVRARPWFEGSRQLRGVLPRDLTGNLPVQIQPVLVLLQLPGPIQQQRIN